VPARRAPGHRHGAGPKGTFDNQRAVANYGWPRYTCLHRKASCVPGPTKSRAPTIINDTGKSVVAAATKRQKQSGPVLRRFHPPLAPSFMPANRQRLRKGVKTSNQDSRRRRCSAFIEPATVLERTVVGQHQICRSMCWPRYKSGTSSLFQDWRLLFPDRSQQHR